MAISEGRRLAYTAIALIIVGIVTGFAIGYVVAPSNGGTPGDGGGAAEPGPQNQVDVEFTLDAFILGYVGVGGDIDGIENPDLNVGPGATVKITIINGDNIEHDVAVENLDVLSSRAPREGDTTSVTFTAPQAEGSYFYLCTVAGHREAGMEGKLVVGEGGAAEPGPTLQKEVTVQLEAHQWYWEPEAITVPQAAKVRLEVTAFAEEEPQYDIHGLGIPAYGISEILPVGETAVVEFVADKAGEFPFDCTAFCGEGHLDMKGKLIVQGADEKEEEKISPANQLDDSPDSSRNNDLIVVVGAAVVVVAVTWGWLWRY